MITRDGWDDRYASRDLVWGSGPNVFVAEALDGVAPRGRALDLACGEGRNAIWLAERGWRATGVDFSSVAIERARRLAAERGLTVDLVVADVTRWEPEPASFDLVVVSYLQVPGDDRRAALSAAARALAPGGEAFLIGHARRNLVEGAGGPQSATVLWEPGDVAAELRALGLEVTCAEEVLRPVEGEERDAIDARLRATRPALASG